jgi:hypothetical protein
VNFKRSNSTNANVGSVVKPTGTADIHVSIFSCYYLTYWSINLTSFEGNTILVANDTDAAGLPVAYWKQVGRRNCEESFPPLPSLPYCHRKPEIREMPLVDTVNAFLSFFYQMHTVNLLIKK